MLVRNISEEEKLKRRCAFCGKDSVTFIGKFDIKESKEFAYCNRCAAYIREYTEKDIKY